MYANSLAMPMPALFPAIEILDHAASGGIFFRLFNFPGCSTQHKSRPGACMPLGSSMDSFFL